MAAPFRFFLMLSVYSVFFFSTGAPAQFGKSVSETLPLDLKPTDVIIWSGAEANINKDGTIDVGLRLETKQNFTIYATKLTIAGPQGTSLIDAEYPEVRTQKDPMSDAMVDVYWGGDFLLKFSSLDPYNRDTFPITIKFLGCTERICLFPYTQTIDLKAYNTGTRTSLQGADSPEKKLIPAASWSSTELSQASLAKQLGEGALPLWLTLLAVFLGGLATNITPCVFPMIPITIRLLGRHGGSRLGSSLYAGGIVATYTAIGSIAGLTGGVFGTLLANPWVNGAFALLFVFLGFSMLGFANFTKLQNIGTRMGAGRASNLNTFLMGAGAGLVAAPCTGPILGGLLIYSAKLDDPNLAVMLFFLYSVGFALPYVFLGMLSGRVSKLKVSPKIQVGVKVAFASVMFALAFYYLKTPAYKLLQPLAGLWSTVGIFSFVLFVASSFLISLRLQKANTKGLQLIPTLLLGVAVFAGTQVLTGTDLQSQLNWHKDEKVGYLLAHQANKPILVDGWADWCIACKEMDATVFQDKDVISELQKNWVLVKLDLTEINEATEALTEKYQMPGLPTLVLIPPNGDLSQATRITSAPSREYLLKELQEFTDRE